MRKIRLWVRGFFGFSRGETNAFLILIPLMFAMIFSEPAYEYWFVRQPLDYSKEKYQLDSLLAMMPWEQKKDSMTDQSKTVQIEPFAFDPNRVTRDELKKLGLSSMLANRIISYRAKGGEFSTKGDLMKIYGIDSSLYLRLAPYIRLPESIVKEKPKHQTERREKLVTAKFDLNLADTSQFIKIYGIGTKLAKRIVAYREKLGGFVSSNQLNEVYGLDSTVVKELVSKSFIEENFQPRLLNINNASEKELSMHPYIKYKLAKTLVAYRMQHGAFTSIDELRKITVIDEKNIHQMTPYLSVKE